MVDYFIVRPGSMIQTIVLEQQLIIPVSYLPDPPFQISVP